ncbi:MAG: T9SS type A sorting domain-containing protein [Saprospiraceae bacterium]|nr:T9SS type A sorting domain-containing protein [Saprospiraceae bacterium]
MKKLIFTIIALFGISYLAISQCASVSNIYSFTYNGKNYEVVKEQKTWSQSAACAVERGGHLVHIDSQAEQDSVYYAIINGAGVSSSYNPIADGGGASYIWIGATDKATEGTWLWDGDGDDSGTSFWTGQGQAGSGGGAAVNSAFVNWGGTNSGPPNEPDNFTMSPYAPNGQDGGAMAISQWPYGIAGEWNDIDTANTNYFVIEIEFSTSVNKINTIDNSFSIFPNPAIDMINLKATHEISEVLIYSVAGQIVLQKIANSCNLNLNLDLSKGIYIVKSKFKNDTVSYKKLIVE